MCAIYAVSVANKDSLTDRQSCLINAALFFVSNV